MKVLFATDHAGFDLKQKLVEYVQSLGHEVEDCGAFELKEDDDYPDFVAKAAREVAENPQHTRAIILGASGQGEAITANRFEGVRAVVYYGASSNNQVDAKGETLSMLESTRKHNDANVLSLGVRFLNEDDAKQAVKEWLEADFSGEKRHVRRINKIEMVQ